MSDLTKLIAGIRDVMQEHVWTDTTIWDLCSHTDDRIAEAVAMHRAIRRHPPPPSPTPQNPHHRHLVAATAPVAASDPLVLGVRPTVRVVLPRGVPAVSGPEPGSGVGSCGADRVGSRIRDRGERRMTEMSVGAGTVGRAVSPVEALARQGHQPDPVRPSDTSSETRKAAPRITCSGCDASWTALNAAHCTAPGCHRTFSSVGLFDRHRSASGPGDHGSCLDPGRLVNANTGAPIAEFRDGMWRGPEMDEATKAKRFGGAA